MKKFYSFLCAVLCAVCVSAQDYPATIGLIGDATTAGWTLNQMHFMQNPADGQYLWIGDLGNGELKFMGGSDWIPSYGPAEGGAAMTAGEHIMALRASYEEADNKFTVTAGRYKLVIDLTGEAPKLTVEAVGADVADVEGHFLYAIGSALPTGWDLGAAPVLKEVENGVFVATLTFAEAGGELKFLKQRDWGAGYGAAVANTPVASTGEYELGVITDDSNDSKFAVSLPGEYIVTVNTNTMKMTVATEATGIENVVIDMNNAVIYDLLGRRVSQVEKAGYYIVRCGEKAQKMFLH